MSNNQILNKVLISVSGKIINELSQKIPSNLVALNELIKNSYDAFSSEVSIILTQSELIIEDNGKGMNEKDIKKLFHISQSEKAYGSSLCNPGVNHTDNKIISRIQQGSKGLGFLAVLKFGENVTWETKSYENNSRTIKFTVNKNEIEKLDDVSKFEIVLEDGERCKHGTKISISLNKEKQREIFDYLKEKRNFDRLLNIFNDETFKLSIEIPEKPKSDSIYLKNFKELYKDRQLFYVSFNSKKDNFIRFFNKGELIDEFYLDLKIENGYSICLEMIIFELNQSIKVKNFPELFRPNPEILQPLIYVNHNLLDNNSLFNPDITRKIKHSIVLPQIIGYVDIIGDDPQIDFNSDRTQFVENKLTNNIKDILKYLNIKIQEEGSKIKNRIKQKGSNIHLGSAFDNSQNQSTEENNQSTKENSEVAKIALSTYQEQRYINSEQIDLKNYIISATNSSGEDIKNEIIIRIGNDVQKNSILESIENECEKEIIYSYNDKETGLVQKSLYIRFVEKKASIIGKKRNSTSLIYLSRSIKAITVDIHPELNKIINEINDLYALDNDKYLRVIACSLRSIFEISINEMHRIKLNSIENDIKKYLKMDQNKKISIEQEIDYIIKVSQEGRNLTLISNNLSIGFNDLKNIINNSSDFVDAYRKTHLGAHKSLINLTKSEVEHIGQKLGIFCSICNELLHQDKIFWNLLEKKK